MRYYFIGIETDRPGAGKHLAALIERTLLDNLDVDEQGTHHDTVIHLVDDKDQLLYAVDLDGAANNEGQA